jgi:hypothetical protein
VAWKKYPTREDAENRILRDRNMGASISPEEISILADFLFQFGGQYK